MKNFLQLCKEGLESLVNIDNYIDKWHDDPNIRNISLSEYLGLTKEQYQKWTKKDEDYLKILIECSDN